MRAGPTHAGISCRSEDLLYGEQEMMERLIVLGCKINQ